MNLSLHYAKKAPDWKTVCLSVFIFMATMSGVWAATYLETFESGSAGWKYGYGPQYNLGSTYHSPTGGNPDAHIHGEANNLYAIWIDQNDVLPYGELNGLMLTIDTKIVGGGVGQAQFYVGRGDTYFVEDGWDISLDVEWTTHTAVLNSDDFYNWNSNTTFTREEVLQSPDDIGIFFGASTVSAELNAEILVDNFGSATPPIIATPEPSSIMLLALAGLFAVGYRKRPQT